MIENIPLSKRGFPIYKANPFVHKIVVEVAKKHVIVAKGDLDITRREDGEYIAPATVGTFFHVEKEEFLKIYTKEMSSFFDLSKAGTRMMGIVFRASQIHSINKCEIFLPFKIALEVYNEISNTIKPTNSKEIFSENSYRRGIRELLQKEFIAEHPHGIGWFFTNPNIFFNGNRVRFVKEYCQTEAFKEVKKQLLEPTKQLSLL